MLGEMNPPRIKSGQVRRQDRGLTLVELMVTVAITAVLIAVAVPSMREMIAKRRVVGVTNELFTDLRYLRSVSIQNTTMVELDFGSNQTSTCYMLSTTRATFLPSTCDCTNPASCNGVGPVPTAFKTVSLPRSDGVTLSSNASPIQFVGLSAMPCLDNWCGASTISVTISGGLGGTTKVWTNANGRAFACSVSGQESNFPACQ